VGSLFWLVPIPLVDSCSSSRLRLLPQCDGVGAASGCRRGRGTAASRPAGWTRWNWRRVNATSRGRRRPDHARKERCLAWAEVQVAEAGGAQRRPPKAVPAPAPLPAWPGVEASAEPGWRSCDLGLATRARRQQEELRQRRHWCARRERLLLPV